MKVRDLERELIAEYEATKKPADLLAPREFLGLWLSCDGPKSVLRELSENGEPEIYALLKGLLESCEDWPPPPPEPWGKGLEPGDNPWEW